MDTLRAILLVASGGAAGSVLRYLTSVLVTRYVQSLFPLATLTANVLGCLLAGFIIGKTGPVHHQDLRWLLLTGFCGGYTTFSAFAAESATLFHDGRAFMAFGYIAISVICGLAAVFLGLWLAR